MSQQRITLFFPRISSKKKASSARCYFLELPLKIRRRIYREAGLATGLLIDVNNWSSLSKAARQEDYEDTMSAMKPLPLGLFSVCSSVYGEVTRILYGENRFLVTRREPRALRPLDRFSDLVLREMRFLVIRLNVSGCGYVCCGQVRSCELSSSKACIDQLSHDAPLNTVRDQDKSILSCWNRFCLRLGHNIQPGQLSLYIICDCETTEMAEEIVKPLLAMPTLRDAALRLGNRYSVDLQQLAKNTVLHLTGHPQPRPLLPFRFLDLPKEIQLHIFGFIGLFNSSEIICTEKRLQFVGCRSRGLIADIQNWKRESSRLRCFCITSHSAFNYRCTCDDQIFASSLFQVSREINNLATEIFYGQSQFNLPMGSIIEEYRSWNGYSIYKYRATPSFARFPQGSVKFITLLSLQLASNLSKLHRGGAAWHQWLDTIDFLSKEANLSILTLEIRQSDWFSFEPDGGPPERMDAAYEMLMRETYITLFGEMLALRGAKNLFTHLTWNACCEMKDGRQKLERELERMVMGEGYNSWEHGKRPGNWYSPWGCRICSPDD